MFNINDIVFVGTKGICKIENITKNAYTGCDKTKEYYVLKPIDSTTNMVVFLPIDTPVKIRYLVSKTKANESLKSFKSITFQTSLSEEDILSLCNSILKEVDFEKRINVFNFLMNKKQKNNKKMFGFQDQKTTNTLLECITQELAFVLNKSSFEIKEQILSNYETK